MKVFYLHINREVVSKKAKEQISKRVLQENKGRQIFKKNEHLLPPVTHTKWSLYLPLVIHPF